MERDPEPAQEREIRPEVCCDNQLVGEHMAAAVCRACPDSEFAVRFGQMRDAELGLDLDFLVADQPRKCRAEFPACGELIIAPPPNALSGLSPRISQTTRVSGI
jgi:hypothetical protein